jgi:malate dehydrogenase (oxaloacetate-decarboxylating)
MLNDPDPDTIIATVLNLQSSFGGINLEDISQPKCFRILDTLRKEAEIPVWHDDQQGTATVTLAALLNALKIVGKRIEDVRIAFIRIRCGKRCVCPPHFRPRRRSVALHRQRQ